MDRVRDLHEPSANTPASPNPLSPDQLNAVSTANIRAKRIRTAVRVAGFNGWSIGAIALLSLPFAVDSICSLLLTIGLGIVATIEFRGRRLLSQFDAAACRLLGWNQIGLLLLITAYCVWSLFSALHTANPLAAYPELRQLGDFRDLYRQLALALYGSLFLGSVLFQGGNALYYFSRERLVRDYVNETEPWIIALQKSTASH